MVLFLYIFMASIAGLLFVKPSLFLAKQWRLLDDPKSGPTKTHEVITPRSGGLVLFPAILLISLFTSVYKDPEAAILLASAVVVFIFGAWDDHKALNAPWKFTGQFLATILLISGGVFVQITSSDLLNIALTFLWVVGITNAFNLVDSKDGLALGLAAMAAAFFMLVTQEAGQQTLSYFSAIVLGACVALLYFNTEPATLFLGDSGAQVLGFMLAGIAIAYTPPGLPQASSWFVPILLLAIPIFDTTLVTLSRLRRRVPVFQGSLDHTYHRLVAAGIPTQRAVRTLHLCAMLLSCIAFIAMTQPPLLANLIFLACLMIGVGALIWFETRLRPKR